MLDESFGRWEIPGIAKGVFPIDFEDLGANDAWVRLFYCSAARNRINIKNKHSEISFSPDVASKSKHMKVVVENADSFYRGRVLQCRDIDPGKEETIKLAVQAKGV